MKLPSDSECFMAKHEVEPVPVRRQREIAGLVEQLPAHLVQRRETLAAAPGNVEHGQVQRQTDQVVADGLGHELVDLVPDLSRPALEDRAGGLCRGQRHIWVDPG